MRYRVLMVEDEPINRKVLEHMLDSIDCDYDVADIGTKAVRLALSKPYDIILLDIQLPETDGYQIAQAIRKTHPAVPIVAQTAHAMPEDKKKCLDAGCNDYLTKPIQYDLLINTLKKYFA